MLLLIFYYYYYNYHYIYFHNNNNYYYSNTIIIIIITIMIMSQRVALCDWHQNFLSSQLVWRCLSIPLCADVCLSPAVARLARERALQKVQPRRCLCVQFSRSVLLCLFCTNRTFSLVQPNMLFASKQTARL